MPRYRLILEYDAADDSEAVAIQRATRHAFKTSHAHGVELLREAERPWKRVTVVDRVDPPGRVD